jgi:hypothetical protein
VPLPSGCATESKQDTAQIALNTLVGRNEPLDATETTEAVEAATLTVEATVDAEALAAAVFCRLH